MKKTSILITFLSVLLLTACVSKQTEGNIVTVTIEPQRYFAEKIVGDKFKINCVVPAGQSPETYDPTPQQMIQLGKSMAYLRIGSIGFEQAWMDKIRENNPKRKCSTTSEGMTLLTEHGADNHERSMPVTTMTHSAGETAITIKSTECRPAYLEFHSVVLSRSLEHTECFIALDPEQHGYFGRN